MSECSFWFSEVDNISLPKHGALNITNVGYGNYNFLKGSAQSEILIRDFDASWIENSEITGEICPESQQHAARDQPCQSETRLCVGVMLSECDENCRSENRTADKCRKYSGNNISTP